MVATATTVAALTAQSQPLGSLSACSGIKSSAAEVPLDESPVATVVDTGKVKGRSQTTHVASTVADVLTQNNCLDAEKKTSSKTFKIQTNPARFHTN